MMEIHDYEIKNMIRMANEARERAYVPYSKFHVGACLKAKNGAYYLGCNIENAAYTPTNCAERTAMFKAVYEGEREFEALAIIWDGDDYAVPCGVCRQALFEFGGPELNVIMAKTPEDFIERSMDELLPFGFGPSNVAGNSAVEGK